jgi:hypothetical protein
MDGSRAFAYRLHETEQGWQWRVVDSDGNTIDAGVAPDKIAARAAIRRARGDDAGPLVRSRPRGWRRLIRAFCWRARSSL